MVVENDGEWHTIDDKFASPGWRATHPVVASQRSSPPRKSSSPGSVDEETEAKALVKKQVEILVLDSDDDEDEGQVKRELSVSYSIGSSSVPKAVHLPLMSVARREDVIDLTADSEDEQPRTQSSSQSQAQPPRPLTEKRKAPSSAPSPTEQIWKKSRVDGLVTDAQSVAGALPPISPAGGTPQSSMPCGTAGQLPPTTYPAQLPPLRLLQTAYVAQGGGGGYVSPVGAPSGKDNHPGGFEQYNGNYNYASGLPRPNVWQ